VTLADIHRQIDAWAERAHREIEAMAVARRRSMGQLFRYARERLLNPKKEKP
jgi:hypothetical protein